MLVVPLRVIAIDFWALSSYGTRLQTFEVLIEKLKIKLGDERILKFFSSMVSCDSNYNKQASDLYNFA